MKKILTVLFSLLLITSLARARVIRVYTVHHLPPYIIEDKQGLTEILFSLMQEDAKNKKLPFKFELQLIPRNRAERVLQEKNNESLLLHTNPFWMNDQKKQKYFWSEPYIKDADVTLSDKATHYDFDGLASLKMDCLVTIRGFVYPYVNEALQKKLLKRYDVDSPESILGMLKKKRCKAGTLPRTFLNYLKKASPHDLDSIYISERTLKEFERYILSTSKDRQFNEFINHFISSLKTNQKWTKAMHDFGLD